MRADTLIINFVTLFAVTQCCSFLSPYYGDLKHRTRAQIADFSYFIRETECKFLNRADFQLFFSIIKLFNYKKVKYQQVDWYDSLPQSLTVAKHIIFDSNRLCFVCVQICSTSLVCVLCLTSWRLKQNITLEKGRPEGRSRRLSLGL